MQYNPEKIIDIFENNASALSVVGKDLKDFFKNVPISDRAMTEYFMRTELGGNPINEMSEVLPQTYWGTSGIQELTLPPTIKACAAGVFRGSDLQKMNIATPFNGTIDLDIFAGATNLTDVYFDPAIAKSVKKITVNMLDTDGDPITLHFPKEFIDRINAGVISMQEIDSKYESKLIFDAEGADLEDEENDTEVEATEEEVAEEEQIY